MRAPSCSSPTWARTVWARTRISWRRVLFLASLVGQTKQIRLGTGTVNLPNTHPARVAGEIAMLDHLLDGRLNFGISPGGLPPDAEAFGTLGADRNAAISANFLMPQWVRSHWPGYVEGCKRGGRPSRTGQLAHREKHLRRRRSRDGPALCNGPGRAPILVPPLALLPWKTAPRLSRRLAGVALAVASGLPGKRSRRGRLRYRCLAGCGWGRTRRSATAGIGGALPLDP